MAKTHQRLDYTRLSEALAERGLVESEALDSALQQCLSTGTLFPQVLVDESLVSDWEIARVASEVFNLPFLTVASYQPDGEAREGLDASFLRRFLLVPLDRFGGVLTVVMPALVSTDVLTNLGRLAGAEILPVVGTVSSNRRWLEENLPAPDVDAVSAPLPAGATVDDEPWANLFDEADAAVQLELDERELEGPSQD